MLRDSFPHLRTYNSGSGQWRFIAGLLALLIVFCSFLPGPSYAKGRMLYGFYIPDKVIEEKVHARMLKDLEQHPLTSPKDNYIVTIERPRQVTDHSFEFLAFVVLLGVIGIFRLANPTYLGNLFKAFRNPSLSTRQLKEQLRQDSPASLLMDLLFCISFGFYLYYALYHLHKGQILPAYPRWLIVTSLSILFIVIYILRFFFLKCTGWLFNIKDITDSYSFNLFLINKVLGLALIPFTIILALGEGQWVQTSLFLSLLVIAILFLNRYLRSGATFGHFLKFSKFHFFMYLCASEILPFAVLMKLVSSWLIS